MGNIQLTKTTTLNAAKYRQAWANFIDKQCFTHGLTLQWNERITYNQMFTGLKLLHGTVEKNLYGRRWWKRPDRTYAIFVLEGQSGADLHCHSLWKIDDAVTSTKFGCLFPPDKTRGYLFSEFTEYGTFKMIPNSESNGFGRAAAKYLTKSFHPSKTDNLIFSTEFYPNIDSSSTGTPLAK